MHGSATRLTSTCRCCAALGGIGTVVHMLEDEISQIPKLKHVGAALAEFARSLSPGSAFKREGSRWVLRPENFVTFSVHAARSMHIRLSLRGRRGEFAQYEGTPLKTGRARSWSECVIASPSQLLAAASYMQHAAELYTRGRNRTHKQQIVTER